MSTPTVWRLIWRGDLPMHDWEGDLVVYNPLSGNSHVLDIVTGEVLRLIAAGPQSERELLDEIVRFLDLSDVSMEEGDDSVLGKLRFRLAVLVDLGLIEPAAAC